MSKTAHKILIWSAIVVVACLLGTAFALSRYNIAPQLVDSTFASKQKVAFPAVDTQDLSPTQQKIIEIVKKEYADQPDGTKYSQGEKQAWCANFVSWVYNEAGVPMKNPNTGAWRIPGTKTLQDYLRSTGKFHSVDSQYIPKVGDLMLYDNPSPHGQHVNMVIKNDNGIVTTIGGNEPGGIRVFVHDKTEAPGFLGYGTL